MSSASQPRKKKAAAPGEQDDASSSCRQHATPTSNCPQCQSTGRQKASKAKIIDFPTEKKKSVDLIHKINEIIQKDPKAVDKAAFVISSWINENSKSAKKKK